jgi:hypothetical protein
MPRCSAWLTRFQPETPLGGLFVSRAQAVKYALSENGNHPATIVLSADIVELDMHRKASPVLQQLSPASGAMANVA